MQSTVARKSETSRGKTLELKLAHSPDSDDAFMFYALATKKISTGNLKFVHVLEDIETLNRKARDGVYDVTAISFHAYPYVADQYLLLSSGASFGERYGPVVVARGPLGPDGLRAKTVAVPGQTTTAYLVLQLYEPNIVARFFPFDRVFSAVIRGEAEAGVVIHEGQITFAREGLTKVVDLGEWWHQQTGLPLPLGGNVVRRSLEPKVRQQIAKLLKQSIRYSLDHREEALTYALQFGRGLDTTTADQFVSMYVNDWTLDYGERGRQAVQTLLDRGFEKGLISRQIKAEFAGT